MRLHTSHTSDTPKMDAARCQTVLDDLQYIARCIVKSVVVVSDALGKLILEKLQTAHAIPAPPKLVQPAQIHDIVLTSDQHLFARALSDRIHIAALFDKEIQQGMDVVIGVRIERIVMLIHRLYVVADLAQTLIIPAPDLRDRLLGTSAELTADHTACERIQDPLPFRDSAFHLIFPLFVLLLLRASSTIFSDAR